ncbi:MAG: hypothetical protein QW103_02630 [Candidatus Pacearchaeota archaeon]
MKYKSLDEVIEIAKSVINDENSNKEIAQDCYDILISNFDNLPTTKKREVLGVLLFLSFKLNKELPPPIESFLYKKDWFDISDYIAHFKKMRDKKYEDKIRDDENSWANYVYNFYIEGLIDLFNENEILDGIFDYPEATYSFLEKIKENDDKKLIQLIKQNLPKIQNKRGYFVLEKDFSSLLED